MMPQLQDLATLICRHRKCFFNVPPFLIVLVVNFFLVYHVFLLNFCITLMSLLLPILAAPPCLLHQQFRHQSCLEVASKNIS
jgi:hypothetical protein